MIKSYNRKIERLFDELYKAIADEDTLMVLKLERHINDLLQQKKRYERKAYRW